MDTPEGLFGELFVAAASQPFVTYYDETSGERSELSAKSLANWVAKTHFLLMDELGLGVGDAAYVSLPAHWISVPVLLGCWSAGLTVTTTPDAADVAFALAPAGVDTYAIDVDAAAVGFRGGPPQGVLDYVASVRPQPDKWATVRFPAGPDVPAIDDLTRADAVLAARRAADRMGLGAGGRLLTTRSWDGSRDWIDTLLAPLAVGGSVVLVRNCTDETVLQRRAEQERATVVAA